MDLMYTETKKKWKWVEGFHKNQVENVYTSTKIYVVYFLETHEIQAYFKADLFFSIPGTEKSFSTVTKKTHGVSMIKNENDTKLQCEEDIGNVRNHGELVK